MKANEQESVSRKGIAAKIRNLILGISGAALLVASLAYVGIELVNYRQAMVDRLSVLYRSHTEFRFRKLVQVSGTTL
jgi:hypothetical protein